MVASVALLYLYRGSDSEAVLWRAAAALGDNFCRAGLFLREKRTGKPSGMYTGCRPRNSAKNAYLDASVAVDTAENESS